jgi:predicted O-methyltransferase YrrM
MNKEVKMMRMLSPKMLNGLVEFCSAVEKKLGTDAPMIVELGSYIGESTAVFLREFPEARIHCVDAWAPTRKYHVEDITLAEKIFDAHVGRYVWKRKCFTDDPKLEDLNTAHLVYIDADHSYEAVKRDIEIWLPRIRKGGIIGGHDYETAGKFGVKRAVDERFGKPDMVFEDTSWLVYL